MNDIARDLLVKIQTAQMQAGEQVVVEHLQSLGLIPATQPTPESEKAVTEHPTDLPESVLDANQLHNLRNRMRTYLGLYETATYFGVPLTKYDADLLGAMFLQKNEECERLKREIATAFRPNSR